MLTEAPSTLVRMSHVLTLTSQYAWAYPQSLKGSSIGMQAHLILTASLIIVPCPGEVRQPLPGEFFIVKQVDRLHGRVLLYRGFLRSPAACACLDPHYDGECIPVHRTQIEGNLHVLCPTSRATSWYSWIRPYLTKHVSLLQVIFTTRYPHHLLPFEEALHVFGCLPCRAHQDTRNHTGIMRGAQHIG